MVEVDSNVSEMAVTHDGTSVSWVCDVAATFGVSGFVAAAIDRLVAARSPFTCMGMWRSYLMANLVSNDFNGPTVSWSRGVGHVQSGVSISVIVVTQD